MDTSDYFEVVSTQDRVFHFRLKGFWTAEVAAQAGVQFLTIFNEVVESMGGKKFLILADNTDFKSPSKEVKEAMTQSMKYARERNLYKAVEVTPSALGRLGIQQAAEELDKDDFRIVVTSVEEAWEKINELKQSL